MEGQTNTNSVVSTKDWVITLIIAAIPIVGFVMLFVWGFGSGTNENKANWAKGALIMIAVFIALYLLFFMIFGAAILSQMSNM